jgi:hypothetical protein
LLEGDYELHTHREIGFMLERGKPPAHVLQTAAKARVGRGI